MPRLQNIFYRYCVADPAASKVNTASPGLLCMGCSQGRELSTDKDMEPTTPPTEREMRVQLKNTGLRYKKKN